MTPLKKALTNLRGLHIGSEERVATRDILAYFGVTERNTAVERSLARAMRHCGWKGPKAMAFGTRIRRGFYRSVQPADPVEQLQAALDQVKQ